MGKVESRQTKEDVAGDMILLLDVLLECSAELSGGWLSSAAAAAAALFAGPAKVDSNRLFWGFAANRIMNQMSMFTSR